MKLVIPNPNPGPLYLSVRDVPAETHPAPGEQLLTDAEYQAAADSWQSSIVPQIVTPRQLRKALNAAGLRATVEAAVAAAPQDVRDEWEYALEIRRDYPLMTAMAAQLGMTDAQLDDLFRAAAQL